MDNNDLGESSCKKHAHSDNTSNGRPLKKAKFPWQVKGKYYLKDQDDAMEEDVTPEEDPLSDHNDDEPTKTEPTNTIENNFDNKVEENLEMLGDYLLKQDFSSLNTLLFGPEVEQQSSKKSPDDNSTSTDQSASIAYPKYTPSYKKVPNSNNNNDSSVSSSNLDVSDSYSDVDSNNLHSPISIEQRSSRIEDQYLKRWQARQIAKGYVDNTINRVLDSWSVSPLPPNLDENYHLNFDVSGLLDDLAGNDGIENEGILMAISAHGLQNNQSNPRNRDLRNHPSRNRHISPHSNDSITSDTLSNVLESHIHNRQNDDYSVPKLCEDMDTNSNIKSKTDSESTNEETENMSPEPSAWRHLSETCNCSNIHRRNNHINVPPIPFHRRNHPDNISQMITDNIPNDPIVSKSDTRKEITNTPLTQTENKTPSGNSNNNDFSSSNAQNNFSISNTNDDQFEDQFDFIDAAVSFAIQAKGLIPF